MKYRVCNSKVDESFDIITEDGGVVSVYHNGDNWVSTYYQYRLTDCVPDDYMWDKLSEYKVYIKDWESESTKEEMIKDALDWLVYPSPNTWEIDDDLYLEFFPK
jgi:hypothetical protein